MSMNDKDLRDFFAACAMIGLITRDGYTNTTAPTAYAAADDMLFIGNSTEGGIVAALKPKRDKQ